MGELEKLSQLGFNLNKTRPKEKKIKTGTQGRKPLDPNILRRSQLRALAVLVECEATSGSSALTLQEIAKKAKVSEQSIKQGMGSVNPENREQHDQTYGYRSLLTRGTVVITEVEGENRYYLSSSGNRKIEQIEEELQVIKETKPNNAGIALRTGSKKPKPEKKKYGKRVSKRIQKDITKED